MDTRELVAAYLLGELDPAQAAEFDRRLQSDPELRVEVEAMRPLIADLEALPGEAWPDSEAVAPAPAAVTSGGEAAVAREAAIKPRTGRRLWSLRPAFALGALIVALLLGGAAGALLAGGDGSGGEAPAPALTLQPLSSGSAASGEVAMPAPDEMVLTVTDLPPSQQGQYYELWLLDGDEQTVPVASFRVGADGTASLRVPLPADPAAFRYFDVSRQHAAEGTEHSADSVLRGPTAPS
ncbi:MAG TPA: anti-sigma factor [Solirubrobacterales bacterium]|nr:anti-sigma factor [Solirubrobacterales bacterium]